MKGITRNEKKISTSRKNQLDINIRSEEKNGSKTLPAKTKQ